MPELPPYKVAIHPHNQRNGTVTVTAQFPSGKVIVQAEMLELIKSVALRGGLQDKRLT
jgi:hypothetical protein